MTLKLLFMSDFWFGILNLKSAKHIKRVKELIFVVSHPKRLLKFCMSQDEQEKKKIEPIFTD